MTNPIIRVHDVETNEVIDREMTDVEFARYTADQLANTAAETARLAEEAAFIKDRADGLAKLEAAGLTPAQARAVARKNK